MNYFCSMKNKSPIPRVHPLILSLIRAINESEEILNVASISENDPGTLGNKYYTSPGNFPPLDEHLYGASLLGDQRPLIALHPHPHWQMTVRNARYRNLKTIQSIESGQKMQQDLQ
jgi:hypothetical protein